MKKMFSALILSTFLSMAALAQTPLGEFTYPEHNPESVQGMMERIGLEVYSVWHPDALSWEYTVTLLIDEYAKGEKTASTTKVVGYRLEEQNRSEGLYGGLVFACRNNLERDGDMVVKDLGQLSETFKFHGTEDIKTPYAFMNFQPSEVVTGKPFPVLLYAAAIPFDGDGYVFTGMENLDPGLAPTFVIQYPHCYLISLLVEE